MKNYISQLKDLLQAGAWTQAQLAQELKVSFAALNRWLQGHAIPHPQKLAAIAKFHRERVGYPAISAQELKVCIVQSKALRRKNLWNLIAKHQALQDDLLLEHTYNSTAIEGTTLTKRETEAVIFAQNMIADKSLVEHLEVGNHATVLRNLFQKKFPDQINEDLIKLMHQGLMHSLREDAGQYSKFQRAIRGLDMTLTHPDDIPEEMSGLLHEWDSHRVKTIREIAEFHVGFELIHPFGDGNGRLGRLLMVLQCLKLNYPPVIIENAKKSEYDDVLEYAQRKSVGPFVIFLTSEMAKTERILKKYLGPNR